jgi:hypothetical protein
MQTSNPNASNTPTVILRKMLCSNSSTFSDHFFQAVQAYTFIHTFDQFMNIGNAVKQTQLEIKECTSGVPKYNDTVGVIKA